ncbi:hypothetical protein BDF19DRAFT_414345 [Syncephalis fuscata]|nr:hypothetical protein BDF19DRAFT_414345 [Syncephalis fuscata]
MEGKNAEEAITFRWERGCLFAVGIAIEQSVNSDLLPEKTQLGANKRHERDGQHHHITVIHRTELDSLLKPAPTNSFSTWLAKQQKSPSISSMDMAEALWQTKKISVKTMTKPSELSTTEWNESHLFADLGLGSNKQVYYKVICWPFGDAIRAALGLSVKQFHITVGFQEADRHDIDKGPNSLRATYIGLNNKKVYLPLARVRLGITMVKRQCELLRDIDAIDATLKALEMHLDYWQTHADTTVDANTKHEVAEVYYSLLAAKAFFMHRIRDVDGLFAVAHEMIACQPLNYQGYVYQGDAYFQQQKRDSAAFVYWIALSCLAASSTSASTVDGLALQSAAARRARDYLWHALERCMKYTDIFIELTTDNTSIHTNNGIVYSTITIIDT